MIVSSAICRIFSTRCPVIRGAFPDH